MGRPGTMCSVVSEILVSGPDCRAKNGRPDKFAHELNIREEGLRILRTFIRSTNLDRNFLLVGARVEVTRPILGKVFVCVTKTVEEEPVACVLPKR